MSTKKFENLPSEAFNPLPTLPPPKGETGVWAWLKRNLFFSKINIIFTIFMVYFVYYVFSSILGWLVFNADWVGTSRADCSREGACWVFINHKFDQFIYGFYPSDEYWRPNFVAILFFVFLIPFFLKNFKFKQQWLFIFLFIYPIIAFSMIYGIFGMKTVESLNWGGLMLTIMVAYVGILAAFPIGVILALGRSSSLPVAKYTSVFFIEVWRGVPLITILFMASNLFPFFFPEGADVNKLLRALIGITLFQSAYIAEVIRGGLQAIPKGQHEASDTLGLPYWYKVFYIILPQAIRIVIPSIVGASISLFKDTTLLLIIGLLDVLAISNAATQDTNWLGFEAEGYVFVGIIFWIFCFSMSRFSVVLENRFSLDKNK